MSPISDFGSASENKVSSRRHALRLQQGELAARCGVSRQFIGLVESGRAQPNVQLALKLAAELGSTVEALFGGNHPVSDQPGLAIDLATPGLPAGARLGLARVGERWVAHPADSVWSLGGGFAEADGVLVRAESGPRAVTPYPSTELEHNVLIAGCDPALALLRARNDSSVPGRFVWVNCGSTRALDLLAAGQVHVAGLHFGGAAADENLRQIAARDPQGSWTMIRFTRWENGWLLRSGTRDQFAGPAALAEGRLRLANRERGAGSRSWIDRALKRARVPVSRIAGYENELPNHWECARALQEQRADVAVAPRAIATAFGLDFVPAEEVAFDLVVPRLLLDRPRVQLLLNRLRTQGFRQQLEMLPGYSASEAGRIIERAGT